MVSVVKNKEEKIKSKKKTNDKIVVCKKSKKEESEDKDCEESEDKDGGKFEPVNLKTRILPTNLKNVIEFNFESTPTALGMWLCKNFDANNSTLVLSENRKIKVTKELIHEILGIPMGEIKVHALRETTTADATTVKWRSTLPLCVYDPDATTASQKKIPISRLEAHLTGRFLVVFFSIFAHGNKDGSVNQRFLPAIEDIENVPKLDWCTYCLECMKKELKNFKPRVFFAGPVHLLALIYVNSTVFEQTIVNITLSAFKAWSTKLLKQMENEESKGGFGQLPILEEEDVENTIVELYTPQIDLSRGLYGTMNRDEELQLFKTKSKKGMRDCLKDILEKSKELMIQTDDKLKRAFSSYPDDEEIKKMMEERNMLYKESYIVGDKKVNENFSDGVDMGDNNETDKFKCDDEVVDQGTEECQTDNLSQKSQESSQEMIGSDEGLVGTKDNAIVPFDLDLLSSQNGTQSTNENQTKTQEMQYEYLEDIVPLPVSQEPANIISSNNKRRKINPEEDVTLSQLNWAIADEPRMIENEMDDNIMKLPFLSTGTTDATKGLAVDALNSKAEIATPPYHSLKLKLKRNSFGNYDAEKVGKSDVVKESTVNVLDAVPMSFVVPDNFIPEKKNKKEKSTNQEETGKKCSNKCGTGKKGRGKKGETKKEMVKAQKAPTKKAEPKTVKENTQKPKIGQKRGAKAMQEDKEDDIVKEKRTVKPSNAMKSPFYDRKVHIYQKWPEAEMKLVEYMWSESNPEGEIVFNGKGLQLEGVFFLSLYPEVEVASPIIDLWSIILNNEEEFRDELSGKRNVYCSTLMLKRIMKFEENLESVLETSGLKDLNDVGLIDTFIIYLERKKHPKLGELMLADARMVPIKWNTTYNVVDCGIFVMRHMEIEGAALKSQLKMLRAKYLAKILLKDNNLKKKKLIKESEAFGKKQEKKSKILTHIDVKVDENLMKRFNETLVKKLE
ncbi:hypothetical protein CTI12_AA365670 [Artemisia annua]|uniref:Ulp1 protease family, C-terminal catalytic domain-containing protein n=1 Tax=Artemisia annua TaxID=35608 RepID=A0A2U1MM10_ARTAN|nr:hypothetical protein CTI12_AA365670 [Artemisia annua]